MYSRKCIATVEATHAMQMSQPPRIRLKQRLTSMVVCVTCKKEVTDKDKVMVCDLCDKWEHVGCLKHNDKLSDKLYEALVGCCSKAVLYVCSPCRKKGMIASRLHVSELKRLRLQEARHKEQLASMLHGDELNAVVHKLREEKRALIKKCGG